VFFSSTSGVCALHIGPIRRRCLC